jgi:dTDP-4-dehydrorhamnose reductase
MRVLIAGAGGQVGRALIASAPPSVELHSFTHAELDISNSSEVMARVSAVAPDAIINAAAYTAVDQAESEQETARRINSQGAQFLARAAEMAGARLLHISTDFVFDGTSSRPYAPAAPTNPLSVYGRTKRDGEVAVLETLGPGAVVLRTSWVYAAIGRNFLLTMMRLMSERGAVKVVSDQIGTPTAARSVAEILWRISGQPDISGILHWSDAGVASWYDFAVAIREEAAGRGLLGPDVTVTPVHTEDYPTTARRPPFSVLDSRQTLAALGVAAEHWRCGLRTVLGEIASA